MVFADTLTGGTIAGVIVIGLITLVVLAVMGAALLSGEFHAAGVTVVGLGVLAVSWGAWFFSMWPLAYEYHHWVDKEGRVQEISKRLVPAGDKGMQEKIVVRMEGQGGVYGITETRASLLKQGMNLHIRCKKAYDFGVNRGAHGWDCKYVSSDLDGEL